LPTRRLLHWPVPVLMWVRPGFRRRQVWSVPRPVRLEQVQARSGLAAMSLPLRLTLRVSRRAVTFRLLGLELQVLVLAVCR
jgi:hypothetical protein